MKIDVNKKIKSNLRFSIMPFLVITLLMAVIFCSLLPNAAANGQDATFNSIELRVTPPVQGIGGDIKIEVTANFFGGCCYHLYAFDVRPELIVPEEVRIIGSLPDTIKSVDAKPGGMATPVRFQWTVTSDMPGTYDLEAVVRTANCGSEIDLVQINIVEGASISSPKIFPKKPSINEEITFSTVVRSGSDHITIKNTRMFILKTEKDYPMADLKAEVDKLYETKGMDESQNNQSNIIDILESYKLLGSGTEYEMEQVQFTDTWRTHLKEFDSEGNVYYWFNVETSDEKNITSTVYKQSLEDLEKKYQLLNSVIWGTLFIVSIGIILILGITWKYLSRPAKGVNNTGIFILGSDYFLKPSIGKRINTEQLSIARVRGVLIIFIIILFIVFIALSIYLGLFQDLITETGG